MKNNLLYWIQFVVGTILLMLPASHNPAIDNYTAIVTALCFMKIIENKPNEKQ